MKFFSAIFDYFRSSKAEIQKVSWPSRQDTIRYSSLVMGVSVAVALFFATLDFGLDKILNAALALRDTPTAPIPTTEAPITTEIAPGLDFTGSDSTFTPTNPNGETPTPTTP